MRDDPKRPYKAIVAAIVGGASVITAEYADVVPTWVVVLSAVVVGAGATYFKKNPKVEGKHSL